MRVEWFSVLCLWGFFLLSFILKKKKLFRNVWSVDTLNCLGRPTKSLPVNFLLCKKATKLT